MSIKQWDSNTQTANTVVGSQFERNTIDDTTPSTDKVYSSSKVQGELDNINTSLANKVDISKLKIQNGYKTITIPPNTATVLSIPFATPYNSTPMSSVVTSGYGVFMKQLSNVEVSKTQIKVTVEHTWSGGNLEVGVYWSAIGIID